MAGIKEPIRLRVKTLAGGMRSLYLDCYHDGKRSYEFLRLYLVPDVDKESRRRNEETMRLATAIKAKRVLELQTRRAGLPMGGADTPLLAFVESVMARKEKEHTRCGYRSLLASLVDYIGDKPISLGNIDRLWVESYYAHLQSSELRPNTVVFYASLFRACLNEAVRLELIPSSPAALVHRPRKEETSRVFLTLDELKRLMSTPPPMSNTSVPRAFVFSCLTGLRYSDIKALTPANITTDADGCRLTFRQQKTDGLVSMMLPSSASDLLDLSGGLCFPSLPTVACTSNLLRRWVSAAGIDKPITFHCARHTFATLMLTQGVEIATISKILGHQSIATTQIYAKVIDKSKTDALSRLAEAVSITPDESQTSNKTDSKSGLNYLKNAPLKRGRKNVKG